MPEWTARDELNRARAIKDRHRDELMALENVVGVGGGWFDDALGGGPIIRVYVREYKRWGGPNFLEGGPVMTELVGEITALEHVPPSERARVEGGRE